MSQVGVGNVDRSMNWDLAAESIVVKIRWFGIIMGLILVQTRGDLRDPWAVRAFLALGAGYAALDTISYRMGEVFLKRLPLFVSAMEALFIALLCYHDKGVQSPFRWYYLLSLICCALRYRQTIVWMTFGLHVLSFVSLAWVLVGIRRGLADLPLTIVLLGWATWASSSLAGLLRGASDRLRTLNADLERGRAELEERVAERSEALRASQARLIHQEKMAAFGLLAAGIAHEVGNPLAAISSLIQILRRKHQDVYTSEKLELADRQLGRIQRTIRELIDFSRPPRSDQAAAVGVGEMIDEVLGIAKYYQRTKDREITTSVEPDLPAIRGQRDHFSQVVLNLVFNAVDATSKRGKIAISATRDGDSILFRVADDGRGIGLADRCRIFQPYFTTKPHGTGLGLFVSKQIIEELGGMLTYETIEGSGTTFLARLPIGPSADRPTDRSVVESKSEKALVPGGAS